ncbi:MAG: flagellar basal body P-ring formation protein FlgA [Rhizobiales bacterium]|nr:flagellar basal body P-ring formation protein FlgA [Hyphomicrobiales bacterium]
MSITGLGRLLLCIVAASPAFADTRLLPVPLVTLYPGDALGNTQIAEKSFTADPSAWANYVLDRGGLAGKVARRTLVAGQPIAISSLKERDAVERGRPIAAIYRSAGFTVSTILMPLQSGRPGEVIQARNTDSGVTIYARVQADGSLLVEER